MKPKSKIGVALLVLLGLPWSQMPAHEVELHQLISEQAAISSENVFDFIENTFAGAATVHPLLTYDSESRTPISWISQGSRDEDEREPIVPYIYRSVRHHFYTPVPRNRPTKALTDGIAGVPGLDPPPLDSFQRASDPNNSKSWEKARDYEFDGLTKPSKSEREANLGHMFYALGHVIHLNQDLSQPSHVRNDNHLHFIGDFPDASVIEKYGLNTYYKNAKKSGFATDYGGAFPPSNRTWANWRAAGFVKLEDFWDRKLYNGQASALIANEGTQLTVSTLGLGEYSNGNFLSDDALYNEVKNLEPHHRFPYPSIELSTDYRQVRKQPRHGARFELFRDEINRKRIFLKKTGQGVRVDRHAALSYLAVEMGGVFDPTWVYKYGVSINSDEVLQDYHSILIPKAIEYSAGILDYFFRGRISATVLGDTLTVRNDSGEPFGIGGIFTVLVEDSGGNRETVGSPVTLTEILPDGDTQNINLPGTVEPGDKCIVVYKGTIGLTDNAPSDPVDAGIAIASTHIIIPLDCTELDLDDAEFLGTQTISDVSQESYDSFGTFAAGTYMVRYTNGAISFAGNLNAWTAINSLSRAPAITVDYNYSGSASAIFSEVGEFEGGSQTDAEEFFAGAKVCFQHTGGVIRLHFTDTEYGDNSGGSPNPTFELYRLSPPDP